MYFPVGWPKVINLAVPGENDLINHICCDAVKILVAAIGDDFLGVWYANPLIPIAFYRRTKKSIAKKGRNRLIVWKPDSRQLLILTTTGVLLLYEIDYQANESSILSQIDPPVGNLRRDSAELFIKENIPKLSLREMCVINFGRKILTICCISLAELLIATEHCELIRIHWTELENLESNTGNQHGGGDNNEEIDDNVDGAPLNSNYEIINLRSIPFYVHQNYHLKSVPTIGNTTYISALEYSPFIGGCAVVFSDKRAAFLIAMHLKFEQQNVHGFWVPEVEDATVCSVNHKFRLLAFGECISDVAVYSIEDTTGGLEFSHRLSLNSNVLQNSLGAVVELKWSPDGCVLAVAWQNGGISLWSTFGSLLMSSLNWDFGLHVDLVLHNPLQVNKIEWSTEGYQLFMTCRLNDNQNDANETRYTSNTLQLNFVKSTLTMNPCMANNSHVLLQGDDTLYLNQGDNLEKMYFGTTFTFPNNYCKPASMVNDSNVEGASENDTEMKKTTTTTTDNASILSESKYWCVLQLPLTYAATNWPIRYSAIDAEGAHIAVAGRTGVAHFSLMKKKWKLFGNESQEKDFVVSGGLLWWQGFLVMGCFSLLDRTDEIRCYPEECKLDDEFGNKIKVRAPVISLNMFRDQLIVLTADGIVSLFEFIKKDAYTINVDCLYEVDVKSICIHPACIVSLTVTNLRTDLTAKPTKTNALTTSQQQTSNAETIIVNVCGRILMIQHDSRNSSLNSLMASCLASCVECFWLSNSQKSPLSDCLWLYSGIHGMRVWLPILPPPTNEQMHDAPQRLHTFMSKRIMLSFPLKLYPLVILFDNVIVLGVECETTLYTQEQNTHFALPFCLLERKSQVYLHRILRQLIKRNLGYSAWEIAKSCSTLPYFPHSLELLLHEVLEEEATSKEPIPNALLPSIVDFIREFPMYLQTIVQCARKTEIALWPYLFSITDKPKDLFQQCLQSEELETAASYLIILQNLEPSIISKQYATLLLSMALQHSKWDLAKDLVRFLKAIDPNEIDSPRSSMVINMKIAPPTQTQSQVNQNPDVFNLVLGPIARERSFSTSVVTQLPKERKDKQIAAVTATPTPATPGSSTAATVIANESSNANGQIVVRRKSDRDTQPRGRETNTKDQRKTEIFCIESILQSHARQLLQKYKLIDLGYMSAFLDFHLVTWLSQESDRGAKLDNFILALTSLHDELQIPMYVTQTSDESTTSSPLDYTQTQRQFLIDNRYQQQPQQTSSHTSESGYFSLNLMDTPTSTTTTNGQASASLAHYQHPSIKENEEMRYTKSPTTYMTQMSLPTNLSKSRSNSQNCIENFRFGRHLSLHENISILSLDNGYDEFTAKNLPMKLAIKIRYLLQLFIEANCFDYALILSILLQDSASIGRIINVIIRSESIATCNRIGGALKCLTNWSLDQECLYRGFIITLQPYIRLLDQHNVSAATANKGIIVNTIHGNSDNSAQGKHEMSEPCDIGDNEHFHSVDDLRNYIQNNHIANNNPNHWQIQTYMNGDDESMLLERQISKDSMSIQNFNNKNDKRRISKEQIGRKETNACSIM